MQINRILAIMITVLIGCALKALPAPTKRRVKITRVMVSHLPSLSDAHYGQSLKEASRLAKEKLGMDITFVDAGNMKIETLFDLLRNKKEYTAYTFSDKLYEEYLDEETLQNHFQVQLELDLKNKFPGLTLHNLGKWFHGNVKEEIRTSKDFARYAAKNYSSSVKQLLNVKINGHDVINLKHFYYHLEQYWFGVSHVLSEKQQNKDYETTLVLTNQVIFPKHSLIHGLFPIFSGDSNIVSIFPVYGETVLGTPSFESQYGVIPDEKKPRVIGYLIAREIGHALMLDDMWKQEDAGCLMYQGPVYKGSTPLTGLSERYDLVAQSPPCDFEMQQNKLRHEFIDAFQLYQIKKYAASMKKCEKLRKNKTYLKTRSNLRELLFLMLYNAVRLHKKTDIERLVKELAENGNPDQVGAKIILATKGELKDLAADEKRFLINIASGILSEKTADTIREKFKVPF